MGSVAAGLGAIGNTLGQARQLSEQEALAKRKLAIDEIYNKIQQQYASTNAKRLGLEQQRESGLENERKLRIQQLSEQLKQSTMTPADKLALIEKAVGSPLNTDEKLAALGIRLPPAPRPVPESSYEKEKGKLAADKEAGKPFFKPSTPKTAGESDSSSVEEKAKDVESGLISLKDMPQKQRDAVATYMRKNNMKPGLGVKLKPEMDAGLRVLHVSLFGDRETPGLNSAVSVLDDPVSRKKLILAGVGATPKTSEWITTKLIHSAIYDQMNPQEKQYVYQLNRAISAINGLRSITGLPRSTQTLMDQYIRELPDPITTPSAKDALNKLSLVEREIRTALDKAGSPTEQQQSAPKGGDGSTPEKAIVVE